MVVSTSALPASRAALSIVVAQHFKDQNPIPVYRRVRDTGIKFPDGLKYIGSGSNPISTAASSSWNAKMPDCCRNGCSPIIAIVRDRAGDTEQGNARGRRAVSGPGLERGDRTPTL